MLKTLLLKFSFTTPLHIGNERADYSGGEAIIQSDTLQAAIFHAWARLGKTDWIRDDISADQPLALGSMFPYAEHSGAPVYFFPRPLLTDRNRTEEQDPVQRKKLKKIQWVDTAVFKSITGTGPTVHRYFLHDKFQSIHENLPYPIIYSQVLPRVTVPRNVGETSIFYIERHFFGKGCGLWTLAQFESSVENRIIAALRLLGDEGIGTDRNIGHGKFSFEITEVLPVNPGGGKFGVSLGLYCPPSEQELARVAGAEPARYDLVKRGGWLSEPYGNWRKKHVYMFKPGSLLKLRESDTNGSAFPVMGSIIDLAPANVHPPIGHPVYRSGRTLFFPVKNIS